ncbi:MAG: hydrogenase expression/formation protein HypE [Deltaproteobacteria bacterium]|jgi:hydrogenase expression/formation protein HypE|nr:hydrogenase expression/formation protein HypE [Deltaproteobacteria bacterium]MBW2485509.1 hydrogenase expression/formation protein HypE [Deltaproteobacteria bacterium]
MNMIRGKDTDMSEKITLSHGSGGRASHDLIEKLFVASFGSKSLGDLEDSAVIQAGREKIAFSTDSFVVDPIFFPGGDIGSLAVHGTVNDLAMRGARPLYLSVGMIIEEGFAYKDLETIVRSLKDGTDKAGVEIVAGDTKVVQSGKADRIFINTTGIGLLDMEFDISARNGRPGDTIILSGTMADHGATILCQREGLLIEGGFTSDSAPLNHMVAAMLKKAGKSVHVLRDPTRGGVGTTLNELAMSSGVGIRIHEKGLPIRDDVRGACELLGLDPLYLANEGKLLAFVAPEAAESLLAVMQQMEFGENACIIGEVTADHPGQVVLETIIGSARIIDMLHGEPLPRIC